MVPEIIETDKPVLQITGEVVAPKEIPNARNYAAGALNLKSLDEFYSRNVDFVAYSVSPCIFDTWLGDMSVLHSFGFETVLSADCDKYPQDGIVVRVNDNEKFSQMGHTSHHPRGAYALKVRQEGVVTTLEDVVWQVGKSGVVSPVGLLTPVNIGGATVSRATLHNIAYIRELNLEIGCQVEVIRAGEIIPRVVRRV
jgi:DNA ligase (NAD+)